MDTLKTRIGEGGRIVIPAEIRQALGVGVGDELLLRVEDGELRAWTRAGAIRKAQAWVRTFVPEGVSLSDELIADRRREAARE
jgi:AbrB family looped-hinge helix DNA binding protein